MRGKSVLQFIDLVTLFLGSMIVAVAATSHSQIGIGIVKPSARFEVVEFDVTRVSGEPGPVVEEWDAETTSVLVTPTPTHFSVIVSSRQYSTEDVIVKLAEWVELDQISGTVWSQDKPDGVSFSKMSNAKLVIIRFSKGT